MKEIPENYTPNISYSLKEIIYQLENPPKANWDKMPGWEKVRYGDKLKVIWQEEYDWLREDCKREYRSEKKFREYFLNNHAENCILISLPGYDYRANDPHYNGIVWQPYLGIPKEGFEQVWVSLAYLTTFEELKEIVICK